MNPELLLTIAGKLVVSFVLVLVNGFFVAAELALVKIRETQLVALVKRGRRGAKAAQTLKRDLNLAITATQLGVTLAGMGLGRYVEPMVAVIAEPALRALGLPPDHWAYSVALGLGFVGMSFVLMIAGEALPKALAIRKTERILLWVAPPLRWFSRLATPFIWVVSGTALWLARRFGVESLDEEGGHSEEEVRLMFLSSSKDAGSSELGRVIVLNALDLRRRVVAEVMRPRREITALSTSASLARCLEVAEKSRYSRLPLCEDGNLDRTLGVVHCKDLFALRGQDGTGAGLVAHARRLIYVPETARLEKLLQLFLERKLHFALVVDEYGGTAGMVTLENVLEELVGQIQDEFDHEKPRLMRRGEDAWELDGSLPLFELAELTGETLEVDDVTTVSGWVTQQLGGFAKRHDRVRVGQFELTVEELAGQRVSRLGLRKKPSPVTDLRPDYPA